jgi:hypothetical protein
MREVPSDQSMVSCVWRSHTKPNMREVPSDQSMVSCVWRSHTNRRCPGILAEILID